MYYLQTWLSPIHLVKKLDKSHNRIPGKYRVTLDCSSINKCFDAFPCSTPSSPNTASRMAQYEVKAVIDISDGFFGINLPVEERKFFGFACAFGTYIFNRMVQGFKNSPASFQHMMMNKVDRPAMEWVVSRRIEALVLSFLDDIGLNPKRNTGTTTIWDVLAKMLMICISLNLTVEPANVQIGPSVVW